MAFSVLHNTSWQKVTTPCASKKLRVPLFSLSSILNCIKMTSHFNNLANQKIVFLWVLLPCNLVFGYFAYPFPLDECSGFSENVWLFFQIHLVLLWLSLQLLNYIVLKYGGMVSEWLLKIEAYSIWKKNVSKKEVKAQYMDIHYLLILCNNLIPSVTCRVVGDDLMSW